MTTVHEVNAALRKAGRPERLKRGRGYFYVYGGGAEAWSEASIYTNSLTPFTVAQVIDDVDRMKAEHEGAESAATKPASPLPWEFELDRGCSCVMRRDGSVITGSKIMRTGYVETKDHRYIAHTANAYPELVRTLVLVVNTRAALPKVRAAAAAVLRKYGEGR